MNAVIKQPTGTNYRVSPEEASVLAKLWTEQLDGHAKSLNIDVPGLNPKATATGELYQKACVSEPGLS